MKKIFMNSIFTMLLIHFNKTQSLELKQRNLLNKQIKQLLANFEQLNKARKGAKDAPFALNMIDELIQKLAKEIANLQAQIAKIDQEVNAMQPKKLPQIVMPKKEPVAAKNKIQDFEEDLEGDVIMKDYDPMDLD